MASEKIAQAWSPVTCEIFNIADTPLKKCENYDFILMGIPTWDYGELQEDWEAAWPQLDALELSGKYVAIFGLGDQIGYPEWFLDAMGFLHSKLVLCGASMCGYTSVEDFEFSESQALSEDKTHFVGLALDEENEFDKTQLRIQQWIEKLKSEFKL